jgi:hypothetical protein
LFRALFFVAILFLIYTNNIINFNKCYLRFSSTGVWQKSGFSA